MPRVHIVKRARKAIPEAGIAVGDTYYWWKTRRPGARSGIRRVSKTYPKQSELTASDFWKSVYQLQESMAAPDGGFTDASELESSRDDWANEARQIGEEQQDKFDNMPEGLQQGSTGEMLQERAQACEAWADEIERVEIPDRESFDTDEDFYEALRETFEEITALSPEC
jgi:hypothetical protein